MENDIVLNMSDEIPKVRGYISAYIRAVLIAV
jgi:hypothetical protein